MFEIVFGKLWLNEFVDYVKLHGISCCECDEECYLASILPKSGKFYIHYIYADRVCDNEYSPEELNNEIDKCMNENYPNETAIYIYCFAEMKERYVKHKIKNILLLTIHEQIDTKTQTTWHNIELAILDEYILRHILHY
jgi:hypothetical protein